MPPAARITDMHVCPMVTPGTPPIPHVGGPIIKGQPNVLTGKLPQARITDTCVCVGPPDIIVKGSAGVFVGKLPAARIGDTTAHGGSIVKGEFTVLIGEIKGGSVTLDPMEMGAGSSDNAYVGGAPIAVWAAEAATQAAALTSAAESGAPFCEACFGPASPNVTDVVTPARPVLSPKCTALADAQDKASLADDAYKPYDPANPMVAGYKRLDPSVDRAEFEALGLDPDNYPPSTSQLRYTVYKKGNAYVAAFKGTTPTSWADWKANLMQGGGFDTPYYNEAKIVAKTMKANAAGEGSGLSFTGHSLGGGLASAAAVAADAPATTFNAAGLHADTIKDYASSPSIDAFYHPKDPLSMGQDNRGVVLGGITAVAIKINPLLGAAVAAWLARSELRGGPVLPQARGVRHEMPDVTPPGASQLDRLNPINYHSMDWMREAISSEQRENGCPPSS
jgi:uncharacterized Zn-binding protein involved in type VI secretion